MEQSQQNPNGQNNAGRTDSRADSPAVATGEVSVGRTLRVARERLGLSVMEVANLLKFAPRKIEALEADEFQHLQGATFLRGFVRGYAKILQLDAQPLLERLPTDIRPHARGIAPLAVLSISRRCLVAMMAHPLAESLFSMDIFCELRLPTLAAYCGFEPVSNCEHLPNVQFDRVLPQTGRGVWHAVKA